MNFIILAAGRSGSTLLVNCLSSHQHVRCHHEPFNQNGWHQDLKEYKNPIEALSYLDSNGLSIPIHKKTLSLLQKASGIHRGGLIIDPFKNQTKVKAEGLKITWAQASPMLGDIKTWVDNKNDMKCIFLYRHDYLARFVSYRLALINQRWNSSHKSHNCEPFSVSKIEFRQFCDREIALEKKIWAMLAQSKVEVSILSYEELIANTLKNVNQQLTFLNCDSLNRLESVTKKLVTKPMDKLITNFHDLESKKVNDLAEMERSERVRPIG